MLKNAMLLSNFVNPESLVIKAGQRPANQKCMLFKVKISSICYHQDKNSVTGVNVLTAKNRNYISLFPVIE